MRRADGADSQQHAPKQHIYRTDCRTDGNPQHTEQQQHAVLPSDRFYVHMTPPSIKKGHHSM